MSQNSAGQSNPYLKAMGITQWVLRDQPVTATRPARDEATHHAPEGNMPLAAPVVEAPAVVVSPVSVPAQSPAPLASPSIRPVGWGQLKSHVAACQLCELSQGRTQTVFGVGDQNADWMFIGEAPGEQEDLQGEPFVGKAGLLLTNMLAAVGLKRETVYIANVIKCRPEGNRDPHVAEIEACSAYLAQQIDLIKPKLIVIVGRVAAQSLLASDAPVGKIRGTVHYSNSNPALAGIPIVVTYHPAYLLRRPSEKAKSWQDLKLAMSALHAVENSAS